MSELAGALWNVVVVGLLGSAVFSAIAVWFERKATARVQRRIGPLWVSARAGGILQPLADLIRLARQPPVLPREAHKPVLVMLTVLAFVASLAPVFVLPMTSVERYAPLSSTSYTLFLALAIAVLASLPIVFMGWASGNKFAVIGSLRESYILITYEVVMLASIVSAVVLAGTLDVVEIVEFQKQHLWIALMNPLSLAALVLAMFLASSSFPFEIAESETDVVAGPYTELSGVLYALSMASVYVKRYAYSVIASIVFLGGWDPIEPSGGLAMSLAAPTLVVLFKALLVMLFASTTRAVYGRLRLDQALDVAWRVGVPLAVAAIAWSAVLRALLMVTGYG
ncbi:MAG: NADH-quinone oxidoreductase subunit NuoH [Acidilobaceae archaeon]